MDIKNFNGKKVRIVTTNGWTYIGLVLSCGEDYIKIRDKYDAVRLLKLDFINMLEEVDE